MPSRERQIAQGLGLHPSSDYASAGMRTYTGAPHGRAARLELQEPRDGVRAARLSVALSRPAPCFELFPVDTHLRRFLPLPSGLPRASLGALDDAWQLGSEDPGVGARIAPVVRVISRVQATAYRCTGSTLEAFTRVGGEAFLEDAERILYVLEEIARALAGEPPLASTSEAHDALVARSVRCPCCGAPTEEVPARVHQPVEVQCRHCRWRGAPAPDAAAAIRALRASAACRWWAEREERFVDVAARGSRLVTGSVIALTVIVSGAGCAHTLALGLAARLEDFAPAGLEATFGFAAKVAVVALAVLLLSVFVAAHVLVMIERELQHREARASVSAEPIECPDFECASCGGTVSVASSGLSRCAYCGGANLPPAERMAHAKAREEARREVALVRARNALTRSWEQAGYAARHDGTPTIGGDWLRDLALALRRLGRRARASR